MNQELQYLRDELDLRMKHHSEQINTTINIVLIVWGGALTFLAYSKPKMELSLDNMLLCFILATVFFISNLIIHINAKRHRDSSNANFKLGAYITVFHEKRLYNAVDIGNNFCWELVAYETIDRNAKKHKDDAYKTLILISTISMPAIMLVLLAFLCTHGWSLPTFVITVICLSYFIISIHLYCKVSTYALERNDYNTKKQHLKKFIQYAIGEKLFDEEKLKDRLGDKIFNIINDKDTEPIRERQRCTFWRLKQKSLNV